MLGAAIVQPIPNQLEQEVSGVERAATYKIATGNDRSALETDHIGRFDTSIKEKILGHGARKFFGKAC
jgi:hypothetical protein